MPYRKVTFHTGEYYHIFNKTIDHKEPFSNIDLSAHFIEATQYYRGSDMQISFSRLKNLPAHRRIMIKERALQKINYKVNIHAYCLMPNHFHFVLRQNKENGIENFIGNLTNSFTRFFNTVHKRKGSLFLARFQAVPINNDAQFLFATRYVHLNPLAAGIVKTYGQLREYRWCSYNDYLRSDESKIIQKDALLKFFRNDRILLRQYVEQELNHEQTQQYISEKEYAQAINKLTTYNPGG